MFEIERHYDGYVVKEPGRIVSLYVLNYRNGKYTYCTDHAYAKVFTIKTAKKHKDALNERG